MVKIREHAEFQTTIPDDAVFDADDECIIPGGRGLLEAVCGLLWAAGYRIDSFEADMEHNGWEADIVKGDISERIGVVYLTPEECWLTVRNWRPFKFRRVVRAGHISFLKHLNVLIRSDPRLQNVLWYPIERRQNDVGSSEPGEF